MNVRAKRAWRWSWSWSWIGILLVLIAVGVKAQPPTAPPGPEAQAVCQRKGRLHRMFHHTAHTIEDKFTGYPDTFKEPPLGYYINQQFAVQVSKAGPHRFTLYDSDFLPGTAQFSPIGASRFNLMFARMPAWSGPIIVEWSPDQPAVAAAQRRQAVLETFQTAGLPLLAQRVVIGPSPYPGARGVEVVNQINNQIFRNQAATMAFPLPPTESASMGVR